MTPRRGAVVDVVVILVLTATILSILDDTFADRRYLVAGLVPVLVLLAMALVARRADEGGWWFTLAALVLYAPLGAVAALREPGPFLVPTLDSVSGVFAETIGAPTTLVSTVPPVDPTGEVMLVPYAIGFLATLSAGWLALGTARPYAPTVPLLVALAATIPLGVLVPSLLVPRGIFVGIVLVAWAAVRARRREALAGAARGSVAAAVTAVVTVALMSGLVSLLVPDDDVSDRVLLRGDAPNVSVSQLVPPAPRDGIVPLLKATGVPDGRRLRFTVLDLYDGDRWVTAEESPGSDGYGTFKRVGAEVQALHAGTTAVVKVRLRPDFTGDWLPLMGELTAVDFAWNPGLTEISDLRYNQSTSTALVVGGVDGRDRYEFESVVLDDTFTRRDPTRDPTDDQRQPAGEFLDEHLRPFDREDLLPLERVLLLARYLRANGAVRDALLDQSREDVERMISTRRMVGTPLQYSALMALGAARLGVPARVVVGAGVDEKGVAYNVDVTSWVELQFSDGTWRPLEPSRYVGSHDLDESVPVEWLDPSEFVQDQLAHASKGDDDEIKPPEGAANPDGTPVDPAPSPGQVVLTAFAVLLTPLLLALFLVPVAKSARRARRRRTSSWSGVFVNGWQEVLDTARDRGTPVAPTRSRLAQASALGVGHDLARRADAAVFAPSAVPAAEGVEFWDACQELRHDLLSEVSRRRRWWALVNPASLVAGWAGQRSAPEEPWVRGGAAGRPAEAGDAVRT